MSCTTILVGKKASNDGSTLIARNDDSPTGIFHAKKLVIVNAESKPKRYKSALSSFEIELPAPSLRYSAFPNVNKDEGIWAAAAINELNVAMTATETITSNDRVLGADPLLKHSSKGSRYQYAGIGEEDLVALVLPYIHSAKEGVIRLGKLLEEYGTYESNGIAFSDENEIWWLESIGGHHYIAARVPDDAYVTMPNQFGLDHFDFDDAYSEQKNFMCSPDLKEWMNKYFLALDNGSSFNPRLAFGSHSDSDHVYNTPRAWYIERYFNPKTAIWDGPNATYTPLSDDIPWANVAERKITVADVKYILSSHYQGTPYDPYLRFGDNPMKGAYRPIGISRTSFLSISQIRPYAKEEEKAIQWFCFASNVFNALVPFYSNVSKVPSYYSNTTSEVSTDSFYWANRLIGALADSHFTFTSAIIERYQDSVLSRGNGFVNERLEGKINKSLEESNQDIAIMVEKETNDVLSKLLYEVSCHMKNGYAKSDN